MQDKQKPGSLGLDFLNEQQRFRRPNQQPVPPSKRPIDGIRQSTPHIPANTLPQPQRSFDRASAPITRSHPLPQPQHSQKLTQPQTNNQRTFIPHRVNAQEHVNKQPEATQHLQNDVQSKRSRFGRKKVWIPALLITLTAIAIGTFLVLKTKDTNKELANTTKKVAFTKQPPASNTIAPNISDAPVSNEDLKNYVVANDLPRMITIDKLAISARVTQIGITYAGSIQTPDNVHDVGWYNGSSKPSNKGVMLMVGHLSGAKLQGVFAPLNNINVGDVIRVQRGDKQIFSYKVIKKESVKAENVTMEQLIKPISSNKAGLNLLTSTDGQRQSNGNPVENLIVYTEQI